MQVAGRATRRGHGEALRDGTQLGTKPSSTVRVMLSPCPVVSLALMSA